MNVELIIKRAKTILKNSNIEITSITDIHFTESITNTFRQLTDINGNRYLLRFNGKQWPPFTRENEQRNLQQLQSNEVESNIIYNDPELQFQISKLSNESNQLNVIIHTSDYGDCLNQTAGKIKKMHSINYFENNFDLAQILHNAFHRLSAKHQHELQFYFQFTLNILVTLNYQQDLVPSHNDLLPSSISIENNNVIFTDLEYSANNIRPYDLALLAIKSGFTEKEESRLIASYDPQNIFDLQNGVTNTKSLVYFLLLLWGASASKNIKQHPGFIDFITSAQTTLSQQSRKMLFIENKYSAAHTTAIGIYWGTFDPPTLAHLNTAITVMKKCHLSKLIIVINDNTNTGKQYNINGVARENLWQSMIDDIDIPANWKDRVRIICQTDKQPFSYQDAKKQYPEQNVIAIVGQDSFNGFKKYKASFGTYDHILVAPRDNQAASLTHEIEELGVSNISTLPMDDAYLSISSTKARNALQAGQHHIAQTQLHASVIKSVSEQGLFRQTSNIIAGLMPSQAVLAM